MALTIRMRIDDNDEHSYYYATGSGEEIELIPLVVDENGVFVPDEGKAYNRVTVNVPETDLETLIVDANGTYNAPDGKAYNVVTVNVQQIINLQNKSASYSANGNYTIQADSGYDGLGTVSVAVDVPQEEPNLQSKMVAYSANDTYNILPDAGYDGLSDVTVEVDVQGGGGTLVPLVDIVNANGLYTATPPAGADGFSDVSIDVQVPTGGGSNVFSTEFTAAAGANYINLSGGQMPAFIYVLSKEFSTVMNGGGRNIFLQYVIAQDPETSGYYFKEYAYKGSATSTTSQSATTSHGSTMQSTPTSNGAVALVYDSANDRVGYFGLPLSDTASSTYGFGVGTKYQLFAVY